MAGADDIGHYDKEYGENCQVLTMVECVGEFDFFASATCLDFFSSVEELDGDRERQGRVCPSTGPGWKSQIQLNLGRARNSRDRLHLLIRTFGSV